MPEPAFADPDSRLLRFTTNHADLDIIRVRSFDVATFVAFGAADLGVAGRDVLVEHGGAGLYQPLDLQIARCRMMVAARKGFDYEAAVRQGARRNSRAGIEALSRPGA